MIKENFSNMTKARFAALIAVVVLACMGLMSGAFAQDSNYSVSRPRFAVLPPHKSTIRTSPPNGLPLWNGSFTYQGTKYTFQMVGTNPSHNNSITVIQAEIIPIKIRFDKSHGNKTFDPNKSRFSGTNVSVTNTIRASPIFLSGIDFTQGGTDLGKTQYIDAFQRGNFWKYVSTNSEYHVLLSPVKVLPEQTFNCDISSCSVGNEFGKTVGLADISWFDSKLQPLFGKLHVQPNTFPIFLTYDVYLTSQGCCVGGYHSAGGGNVQGQTYAYSTTIDQGSRVFSQDIAALSHEVGEWMDDPLVNGFNNTPCGPLEVGDPLVLHDFPYSLHNFTYHLQDLVWLPWFGARTNTSANGWYSFQDENHGVCQ
jgi:hypothetical protein